MSAPPPAFEALQRYEHRHHYFYRTAAWHWLDDRHIVVYDPLRPRLITLDDWPQLVFLDASGKITVAAYLDYLAGKYEGKVPPRLDGTLIHELGSLAELKLIAFADEPTPPLPAHDKPEQADKPG